MIPSRLRRAARQPVPFAMAAGLVLLGVIAVAYPVVAPRSQSPLAIFVIPVLFVAALGSARQTAVVGAAATVVAAVEGVRDDDLDGMGLGARLGVIVVSWLLGIVVAIERARREHELEEATERSVLIDVFQSSLAPRPAPPRGVVVQARFRFGDERLQLGGDFLDAIELPDGALGYVIGDVCGHGVRSAALGSAMRTGWKTIATYAPSDPAVWADTLERTFFRLGRREGYVTLNAGRYDAVSGTVTYVSAGHPWPVVIGERAELATPVVSPPVGVARDAAYTLSQLTLAPGSTLVLYTDGLYEHPGAGNWGVDGEERLLEYLERHRDDLDLDVLLDHFGRGGFDDDVALMTICAEPDMCTDPGTTARSR